jgi:L-iditol 2-dehydrogenase
MRLARYLGGGRIEVVEEPEPEVPAGGLLVQTEACGLCSGELMDWYMDRKVPHVLGHEVCGRVLQSDDARFPAGARVFPHHHAPCLECFECRHGRHVHCETWRRTKLSPGGMAERFVVPRDNLRDTHIVDDLRPEDAALVEPLACVVKSLKAVEPEWDLMQVEEFQQALKEIDQIFDRHVSDRRYAVVGLGAMGLMHMLLLRGRDPVGYDVRPERRDWAKRLALRVNAPDDEEEADVVFVCPGSQEAFDFAMELAAPEATIVMFAPLPPGEPLRVPQRAYFRDLRIAHAYSCGPDEVMAAITALRSGTLRAEQVVSDFIELDELPDAYRAMKGGEILKAMVRFT